MVSEYRVESRSSFEELCSRVPEIVSKNGFAVLAEIKTSEIMKSKGFDYANLRTYDICNASYASRALGLDQRVETIVPCHLVVKGVGEHAEVSAQMPSGLFESLHKEKSNEMEGFLTEVEKKLKRIVDNIANGE